MHFVFADEIKAIFIRELNKNLASPVLLAEENIEFSLLNDFPNASVSFREVGIQESVQGSETAFLSLDRLALRFRAWDLIKGSYRVDEIKLQNGYVHLKQFRDGSSNFKFWKTGTDSSSKELTIDIQRVLLDNIELVWFEEKKGHEIKALINSAEASGEIQNNAFKIDLKSEIDPHRVQLNRELLPINQAFEITTQLSREVDAEHIQIGTSQLVLESNKFDCKGSIQADLKSNYQIEFTAPDADLTKLIAWSQEWNKKASQSTLQDFQKKLKSSGKIDLSGQVNGNLSSKKAPEVKIDFALRGASLQQAEYGLQLQKINLDGFFEQGQNERLQIQNFFATQAGELVELDLTVNNFRDPKIDLSANGRLALAAFSPWLQGPGFSEAKGFIDLQAVEIHGRLADLGKVNENQASASGLLLFDNLSWLWNSERVRVGDGSIRLNNDFFQIDHLQFEGAGSTGELNARMDDAFAWFFLQNNKPIPYLEGSLTCSEIDLDRLIKNAAAVKDSSLVTNNSSSKTIELPNWSGKVQLEVEKLHRRDLIFEEFQTELKLSPGYYKLEEVRAQCMEGRIIMQGSVRQMPSGKIILRNSGKVDGLNVKEVFRQFEDFGQNELTQRHLRGKIYGDISLIENSWDNNLKWIEEDLLLQTSVEIIDGELIAYKPVEALSSFIRLDELRHIEFSSLENEINIQNRRINIPVMSIHSNALDLELSGTHDFDNMVDYEVKVALLDVLSRKFRKNSSDRFEEQSKSGLSLYVSMEGPAANPKMAYNKKEARQTFQESGSEIFSKPDDQTERKSDWHGEEEEELPLIDWDEDDGY